MEDYNQFLGASRTTNLIRAMWSARAVGRSTQVAAVALLVALVVKHAARNASVKPIALAPGGHVEQVIVAECHGCKKDREKKNQTPRQLTRLPAEVTQDSTFKRKGLPVQLCLHCDGDAMEEAIKTHKKRVEK